MNGFDVRAFLGYIAEHFNQVAGVTLALTFVTSMILLIRSIGEKNQDGSSGGSMLDLAEIEGAMKRVLSTQPVSVVAGGDFSRPQISAPTGEATASGESADTGADAVSLQQMQEAVRDREAHVLLLTTELDQVKAALENAERVGARSGGGASAGSGNEGEIATLKSTIQEMQARLAEYEIIEDDIADLSMFKDENAKLKIEIEEVKARLANAPPASAAAAPGAATPVAAVATADVPQPNSENVTEIAAGVVFEKSEKFELDFNDEIMQEFASAVHIERAPPPDSTSSVPVSTMSSDDDLDNQTAIDVMMVSVEAASAPPGSLMAKGPQAAVDALLASSNASNAEAELEAAALDSEHPLSGSPDPDKVLSEIAGLDAGAADSGDVLDDVLDTDKLLSEMSQASGVDSSGIKAAAKPTEEVSTEPVRPPMPVPPPEEDLLAEFKSNSGDEPV